MRVLHGLPGFEVMAAALAFVIVGGHGLEVRWGFEPPREKAGAQYAAPPCRCKRIFPSVRGYQSFGGAGLIGACCPLTTPLAFVGRL